jgi:hypothetical protein
MAAVPVSATKGVSWVVFFLHEGNIPGSRDMLLKHYSVKEAMGLLSRPVGENAITPLRP